MVRWQWWALVRVVLLVCPRGLGVGWCGVAAPGSRPGGPGLVGGRTGAPPDLSWSSWPGRCQGRVIPPVPAGMTWSGRPSDATLGGKPRGLRRRRAGLRGPSMRRWFRWGVQAGVPKGRPALRGPQLCRMGGVCWVEECAELVRCFFLSAEGGVEPAASDSEVVCYLLWCRLCPRFRRRGCYWGAGSCGSGRWRSRWWR